MSQFFDTRSIDLQKAKDRIEELERQLASMETSRNAFFDRYVETRKQVALLREALKDAHEYAMSQADYYPDDAIEALAAIDDAKLLEGYVLCDAEPVAEVKKHTGSLKDMAVIVWTDEQPAEGTELYARRKT